MSKVDRIAESLKRVSPEDAWEMMMNTGALEIDRLKPYRRYAFERVLKENPDDYKTAEMYSYLLVWVAARALISGRRPKAKQKKTD